MLQNSYTHLTFLSSQIKFILLIVIKLTIRAENYLLNRKIRIYLNYSQSSNTTYQLVISDKNTMI